MLGRTDTLSFLLTALAATAITLGCDKPIADQNQQTTQLAGISAAEQAAIAETADEHAHKPGSHGGNIVSLGRDSYHVEAIFEKDGALRLYTLGKDEDRIQEVENQILIGYVKTAGGSESTAVNIQPEPQTGDSPGKTSQFVGSLPEAFWGQSLEVTIPNINISGERFRLRFASVVETHAEDAMPSKVTNDEERELYLTAGGKYTDADIAANGNVTASEKFQGFMSAHDMNPKVGDTICPVTLTKANAKCAWVVGGKKYEFCCPPCVDEFVKLAKFNPEQVKEPQDYVKR